MEEAGIRSGIKSVRNFFSLVKFSHTVFAMPFALIGFTLAVTVAGHNFSLRLLLLVVLCMVFARNAAMGFNRLVDRRFDALNPRTSRREIPAGIIKPGAATVFVIANAVFFIAATAFINRLTLYLSPVALTVILGYSLTKRFTSLSHFILGLGLSLAPIGAYISVTGSFDILPLLFSLMVITWVSGFDIIYALQDDEFDLVNKLHSIPSGAGRKDALRISAIVHFVTVLLVIIAGIKGDFSWIYWAGSAIFSALLIYQHSLVRPDDLHRIDMAFATTNGIASILFAFFTILSLVLK
jgi:4-hydroxybenzoate polyprenyltransferase